MTRIRLDITTRILAMLKYSPALQSLAAAYPDALPTALPGNPALETLRDRTAKLAAAHPAWVRAYNARVEARLLRDAAEGSARTGYGGLIKRVRLLAQSTRNDHLLSALQGCPAPSAVHAYELVDATRTLTANIASMQVHFTPLGLPPAMLTPVTAKGDELEKAEDALVVAESARGEASSDRKQARQDLLDQLRLVDGAFELYFQDHNLDKGLTSLESIRQRCLSRSSAEKAENDEVPEGDDLDIDGDDLDVDSDG